MNRIQRQSFVYFNADPDEAVPAKVARRGRGALGVLAALFLWAAGSGAAGWLLGWIALNAALLAYLPLSRGRGLVTIAIAVIAIWLTVSMDRADVDLDVSRAVIALVVLAGGGAVDVVADRTGVAGRRRRVSDPATFAKP